MAEGIDYSMLGYVFYHQADVSMFDVGLLWEREG